MQGVVNGKALTEKFWVPGDFDVDAVGGQTARPYAQLGCGADGNGRLADDHRRTPQLRYQGVDDGVHVAQIGAVFALLLRRPDAEEVHIGELDGGVVVRREVQPGRGEVVAQHLSQAWLVERDVTAREFGDLAGVDVDAEYFVTQFGHAGGVRRAEIARAEHSASHKAGIGGRDELIAKRHLAEGQR